MLPYLFFIWRHEQRLIFFVSYSPEYRLKRAMKVCEQEIHCNNRPICSIVLLDFPVSDGGIVVDLNDF